MRIVRVTPENQGEWGERIQELEAQVSYPLGDDRFCLSHGADYFAFFRRLGEVRSYVGLIDGEVACTGSGVLRPVQADKGRVTRAWYLCDLKVHPRFRGHRLPARFFGRVFLLNYLRCPRAFAVTMNAADGGANRVVRILERFPWIPLRAAGELVFYVWSESELRGVSPLLNVELGDWRLRSLAGIKDLTLQSTGKSWPLYHIEGQHCLYGTEGGAISRNPVRDAAHMLGVRRGSALHLKLDAAGCRSVATASIVAHRLGDMDWGFLASSEI